MPHVQQIVTPLSHNTLCKGYMCPISTVFPTCSRVNQVSIVTGLAPDNHGIVGDYCYDGDIKDSDSLFADSILTELSHDSINILFMSITEQYREQLTYDLHPNSTSLSLELLNQYANDNTYKQQNQYQNQTLIELLLKDNDILNRLRDDQWCSELNGDNIMNDVSGKYGLYLLEIMRKIIENEHIETPLLNYIALTPATIQHYEAYKSPQIMDYLKDIDGYLQYFDDMKCRYGVTSGHGTNYKLAAKGDISIINIEQKINECWIEYGKQENIDILSLFDYKIILQQYEQNVLYGFVHIHIMEKNGTDLNDDDDDELRKKLIFFTLGYLRDIRGIYSSIGHEDACSSLELPSERIGDVVLFGDIDTLFCDNKFNYDKRIKWRLSNGCLDESTVPLILNERPTEAYLTMLGKGKGRIYHLFDILLNGYDHNLQDQCPYKYTPSKYQYIGK